MSFIKVFPQILEKSYSTYKDFSFNQKDLFFPFVKKKGLFLREKFISLPFTEMALVEGKISDKDIQGLLNFIGKEKTIEIRASDFNEKLVDSLDKKLAKHSVKGHIITELTNEEDLWKRFAKHTRNDIRKAEKSGLSLKRIESENELKKFYKLYLKEIKRFGTPQHSYKFFNNCFKIMQKDFLGFNCYKNSILIGSIIVFISNDYAYVSFNVSNPKYRNFRPNDTLYWETIKECMKKQIKYLDLGQIDLNVADEGRAKNLLKFKRKWLGKVHKKYLIGLNIENSQSKKDSLKKFRTIWSKLPIFVVRFVGPRVVSRIGL